MRRALLVVAVLMVTVFTSRLTAQFSPIPNTGCGSAISLIEARGTGRVGTAVSVSTRCTMASETAFLLIGQPVRAPIAVAPPTACVRGCALGCQNVVVLPSRSNTLTLAFTIPRDTRLIGLKLCLQGVCANPRNCVLLSHAMRMRIF